MPTNRPRTVRRGVARTNIMTALRNRFGTRGGDQNGRVNVDSRNSFNRTSAVSLTNAGSRLRSRIVRDTSYYGIPIRRGNSPGTLQPTGGSSGNS